MDVPGLRREEVAIELDGETVTIRGERRPPFATQDDARVTPARIERAYGAFERTLRVPKGVDGDAIQGTLDHGVLTVRIPVPKSREPRRVEIAGGEAQRERDTESVPA
jgi:HSP20 family protein